MSKSVLWSWYGFLIWLGFKLNTYTEIELGLYFIVPQEAVSAAEIQQMTQTSQSETSIHTTVFVFFY